MNTEINTTFRRANVDDIGVMERLIAEATDWMRSTGINQWLPGEFKLTGVADWVDAGDTWVATENLLVVGTVRIQSMDPFWPDHSDQARYVHRLTIDRRYAGRGLGRRILALAEEQVRTGGISCIRSTCSASNERLIQYYGAAGYRLVDIRQERSWIVARYEKQLF